MNMEFNDVVLECLMNKELVAQFDRLNHSNLTSLIRDTRTPIEKMIDEATGYQKVLDYKIRNDMHDFLDFVFECIYLRLLDAQYTEGEIQNE